MHTALFPSRQASVFDLLERRWRSTALGGEPFSRFANVTSRRVRLASALVPKAAPRYWDHRAYWLMKRCSREDSKK